MFFVSAGTYDPNAINPSVCTSQCGRWRFRYAALTEGKFCFCSTRTPTGAVTSDLYCDMPCSDTSSATMCGGLNYIRSVHVFQSVARRLTPVPGIQTRLQNSVGRISHCIFINGFLEAGHEKSRRCFPASQPVMK